MIKEYNPLWLSWKGTDTREKLMELIGKAGKDIAAANIRRRQNISRLKMRIFKNRQQTPKDDGKMRSKVDGELISERRLIFRRLRNVSRLTMRIETTNKAISRLKIQFFNRRRLIFSWLKSGRRLDGLNFS